MASTKRDGLELGLLVVEHVVMTVVVVGKCVEKVAVKDSVVAAASTEACYCQNLECAGDPGERGVPDGYLRNGRSAEEQMDMRKAHEQAVNTIKESDRLLAS